MIDGKPVKGLFINNICGNGDIPDECVAQPQSLFYFLGRLTNANPSAAAKCFPLISIIEFNQLRLLDNDRPDQLFSITDKQSQTHFKVTVICDSKFNYPQYTTSIDSQGISEFHIASKFSCGVYNESARDLDNQKIWLSILLIIFGLFILSVAGTSFKRFLVFIAGIILFVFLIFMIFTFFGFQLGGYASAFIFGSAASIAFFINVILKKIKELFNAVTTLLTVKIGYTYGSILFPDSPIHERVI